MLLRYGAPKQWSRHGRRPLFWHDRVRLSEIDKTIAQDGAHDGRLLVRQRRPRECRRRRLEFAREIPHQSDIERMAASAVTFIADRLWVFSLIIHLMAIGALHLCAEPLEVLTS